MKKFLTIILVVCMVILCVSCTTAGADVNKNESDISELYVNEEMKTGKYYREGGTEEQYIEVYDGFGIQFFGFDFYQRTYDLNKELFETLSEEELEPIIADMKAEAEFRESYLYYQVAPVGGSIVMKKDAEFIKEGLGGWCITKLDENTLLYEDGEKYIYKA